MKIGLKNGEIVTVSVDSAEKSMTVRVEEGFLTIEVPQNKLIRKYIVTTRGMEKIPTKGETPHDIMRNAIDAILLIKGETIQRLNNSEETFEWTDLVTGAIEEWDLTEEESGIIQKIFLDNEE